MGQISKDIRFQEVRNGLGILRSWWAKLALGLLAVAVSSWGQLSLDTSHPLLLGLDTYLPALSGTTPRILITLPTRMPSGNEVLWGTFYRSRGVGGIKVTQADRDRWVRPREKTSSPQTSRIREKKGQRE